VVDGLALATASVALGHGIPARGGSAGAHDRDEHRRLAGRLAAYATIAVPKWNVGGLRPCCCLCSAWCCLQQRWPGRRWRVRRAGLRSGPLTLQTSLIVVPLAIVLFARAPDHKVRRASD
jgi:hypothetical protein